MHQTRPPCADSVRAAEFDFAYQRMAASIEVTSVAVDTEMVLLYSNISCLELLA